MPRGDCLFEYTSSGWVEFNGCQNDKRCPVSPGDLPPAVEGDVYSHACNSVEGVTQLPGRLPPIADKVIIIRRIEEDDSVELGCYGKKNAPNYDEHMRNFERLKDEILDAMTENSWSMVGVKPDFAPVQTEGDQQSSPTVLDRSHLVPAVIPDAV